MYTHFRQRTAPRRWLAAACAYLVVSACLTGCDSRGRGGGRRLPASGSLVVIVGPAENHPQWPGIRGGARRYAETIPYLEFDYVAPKADNAAERTAMIADVIARKPAAVCLYVTDADSCHDAARAILDSGILLVTMGAAVPDLSPHAVVEVNLAEAATTLGKELPQIAAGRRSYLLLHEEGASELATTCYQRFWAHALRQSSVTLLEARNCADQNTSYYDTIAGLTETFQNAGLIVSLNPAVWLDDQARGLLGGRTAFATLAAPPKLWPALRAGTAAALVGPLDGDVGFAAVRLATSGLAGEQRRAAPRPIECELVTSDNLDDFARRYAEAAGADVAELLPQER